MNDHSEDKIARIHLILNEEPNSARGDKRALARIREVMYGAVPTEEDEKDDTGNSGELDDGQS